LVSLISGIIAESSEHMVLGYSRPVLPMDVKDDAYSFAFVADIGADNGAIDLVLKPVSCRRAEISLNCGANKGVRVRRAGKRQACDGDINSQGDQINQSRMVRLVLAKRCFASRQF